MSPLTLAKLLRGQSPTEVATEAERLRAEAHERRVDALAKQVRAALKPNWVHTRACLDELVEIAKGTR